MPVCFISIRPRQSSKRKARTVLHDSGIEIGVYVHFDTDTEDICFHQASEILRKEKEELSKTVLDLQSVCEYVHFDTAFAGVFYFH